MFMLLLTSCSFIFAKSITDTKLVKKEPITKKQIELPEIETIIVQGNNYIKTDAILHRLPYKVGMPFDVEKSGVALNHLYALGYFGQVTLEQEISKNNKINLYVTVQEKKLLDSSNLAGNKALSKKKIEEKLQLSKIESIDEEQAQRLALAIKKMYEEENFHTTTVTPHLNPLPDNPDKLVASFDICEGPKARVVRVNFKGVTKIPERILRSSIFTREHWLISFMDDSGKYNEEMLEMDKSRIEYLYKDRGYITAKVTHIDIKTDQKTQQIDVTFTINEGPRYTVNSIMVHGDDEFDEAKLKPFILVEEGKPYIHSKLGKTINLLKDIWGSHGYIYAEVYPQIKPNEAARELDITLHVEKGNKLFVRKIDITGNIATRDKVIRREIVIDEGELITTPKLEISKERVERTGYFDRAGVNWKTHKINKTQADLEMVVKEVKTGHAGITFAYGNEKNSQSRSAKLGLDVNKTNLFGKGWDVGAMIQTQIFKKRINRASLRFADPYFLDSRVSSEFSIYVSQDEYESWADLRESPIEKRVGSSALFGFVLPFFNYNWRFQSGIGFDCSFYDTGKRPETTSNNEIFKAIVRRSFQPGTITWLDFALIQDTRNHPVYPNRGYKITLSTKFAPAALNNTFSMMKNELEYSWYSALIGEDSLVLGLHAKAGICERLMNDKLIPYKELFHMGGQDTVRGFIWGGVGPAWRANGSPLGARKAILAQAEFIFPLVPDYSMKGHFFYDCGAGWDTPKDGIPGTQTTAEPIIIRDNFNLRHSVGFGLNLVKPFPAKIDWGYKLDRNKKTGESASEFHISMNTAW